MVWVSRYWT